MYAAVQHIHQLWGIPPQGGRVMPTLKPRGGSQRVVIKLGVKSKQNPSSIRRGESIAEPACHVCVIFVRTRNSIYPRSPLRVANTHAIR